MEGRSAIIKVAAYNNHSIFGRVDWTLDCLKNFISVSQLKSEHENLDIYVNFINNFKPDLIISDLDYCTSHIAVNLGIPLWQCSSSLITHSVPVPERKSGIKSKYMTANRISPLEMCRIKYMTHNSANNFVYSHFGDLASPPTLLNGFTWVRPYHKIGKLHVPCQHNLVAGLCRNNKNILELMQRHSDSVVFTEFPDETYKNLVLKSLEDAEEYYCNLRNSNLFLCEGQTSFLADAYYNNKYALVMFCFNETECIIAGMLSERRNLCKVIFYPNENLKPFMEMEVIGKYNDGIKYLHEHIEDFQK